MSDEYEIRQLVEKYADAVCRRDRDDWASTWSDDSLWNLGLPPKCVDLASILVARHT